MACVKYQIVFNIENQFEQFKYRYIWGLVKCDPFKTY